MRFANSLRTKSVFVLSISAFVCMFIAQSATAAQQTGRILGWGEQVVGVDLDGGFIAVAAGGEHSLGLKKDGSIVAWGRNYNGECDTPSPNADFVAVAAGGLHSLGLKVDGSIVAWGDNYDGQCDIPSPNADFIAVAARGYHSLGLKKDGFIAAWGSNDDGECNIPSPNADFIAIAAGLYHSLALKVDGAIAAWGSNYYGQCNIPSPNADFIAVAAGQYYSLGLKALGWNQQGMPFYAAGVSYTQKFNVAKPTGKYSVKLPEWCGSVARVTVNGKPAGRIYRQPWQCDVTKSIRKGQNTIEVTVVGALKNTLGPHHNNPPLGSAWPGMFHNAPNPGPPPGAQYSNVPYGLFKPFELVRQ